MSDKQYLDFLAKFGISSAHPGGFPLTKALLEDAKLTPNHHVLDVGCGTGETSVYISKTFQCDVTAIDLHPDMIAHAKKRIQDHKVPVQLVQGDVQQLPFDDQSFDAIFAESVTVFTNYKQTLNEYARVLKPGGHLYDVEMTTNRPLHPLEEDEIKRVYQIQQVPTEHDWVTSMKRSGFSHVDLLSSTALLKNQPQAGLADGSQFDLSKGLDLDAFNTWLSHISIMDKYRNVLSYRIYKATI